MVWNKTSDEKVNAILNECLTTDNINEVIAEKLNCSAYLVGDLCRRYLSIEQRKGRFSRLARQSKMGDKNPMFGKCGTEHHNHVPRATRINGYRTVFPPCWWTGNKPKGRVYEHIYIWAESTGETELPKGHVVHHIDGNIDNNLITNLQLLTISEHIKLHWRQRKEQRLESNLVGGSAPEAHSNQNTG